MCENPKAWPLLREKITGKWEGHRARVQTRGERRQPTEATQFGVHLSIRIGGGTNSVSNTSEEDPNVHLTEDHKSFHSK